MIKLNIEKEIKKNDFIAYCVMLSIIFFFLGALSFLRFGIYASIAQGGSMEETLQDGDRLLFIGTNLRKTRRGDIVSFEEYDDIYLRAMLSQVTDAKVDTSVSRERIRVLKRIIGMPNETVTIQGNRVYINNELLDEPYAYYSFLSDDNMSITLGDNEYFLMGDNRLDSIDSRHIGPVTKENITSILIRWRQ